MNDDKIKKFFFVSIGVRNGKSFIKKALLEKMIQEQISNAIDPDDYVCTNAITTKPITRERLIDCIDEINKSFHERDRRNYETTDIGTADLIHRVTGSHFEVHNGKAKYCQYNGYRMIEIDWRDKSIFEASETVKDMWWHRRYMHDIMIRGDFNAYKTNGSR